MREQFTEILAMYQARRDTNSRAQLARLREEINGPLEGMSSMGHDHRYHDQRDSQSTHDSVSRSGLFDGLRELTIHDEDYGPRLDSVELPITQWGQDWAIPRCGDSEDDCYEDEFPGEGGSKDEDSEDEEPSIQNQGGDRNVR